MAFTVITPLLLPLKPLMTKEAELGIRMTSLVARVYVFPVVWSPWWLAAAFLWFQAGSALYQKIQVAERSHVGKCFNANFTS
jgi:hypothetical protein